MFPNILPYGKTSNYDASNYDENVLYIHNQYHSRQSRQKAILESVHCKLLQVDAHAAVMVHVKLTKPPLSAHKHNKTQQDTTTTNKQSWNRRNVCSKLKSAFSQHYRKLHHTPDRKHLAHRGRGHAKSPGWEGG